MTGLLRRLTMALCSMIYKLIPSIYDMFFKFANGRFFTDEIISQVSSNIYVIVSVVMLFAFSVTILSAIVNPDLLSDKKKGVSAMFKRAILGILLIVFTPLIFDEIYKIQGEIMEKGLIEKLVVGISYEEGSSGGNGGQVIAGTLISSVVYPVDPEIQVSADVKDSYTEMVSEDISAIDEFEEHINVTKEGEEEGLLADKHTNFAFEFNGLVALLAGGVCCYILLLFSIDTAIRMVKLAFLELTAPISYVSYIAVGDDILKRWTKEAGRTFAEVFIRIAAISFYILLIANLDSFMNRIDGGLITKVVLIVGLLIFVKQIPEFINNIFGTNIKAKGGIGGRLGQMAGVGEIAKNAWGKLTKAASNVALTAAGLGAGIGALGLGGAAALGAGLGLAHHGWNRGFRRLGARPGRETTTGRTLRGVGSTLGAFFKGSNPITGIRDAGKAYSESDVGKQRTAERETLRRERENNEFNDAIYKDKDGNKVTAKQSKLNLADMLARELKLNGQQKRVLENLMNQKSMKADTDKIKENRDSIVSSIATIRANNKDNKALDEGLAQLQGDFLAGKLNSDTFAARVSKLVTDNGLVAGDGRNLVKNMDEISNILDSNSALRGSVVIKTKDENGKDIEVIKIKKELDAVSRDVDSEVEKAQKSYDDVKNGASQYSQEVMDRYSSNSDYIQAENVRANSGVYDAQKNPDGGKSGHQNDAVFNTYSDDSASNTGGANSTNSSSTSQASASTNEAYSDRMFTVGDTGTNPTSSSSTSQTNTSTNEAYSDRMFTVGGESGGQTVVNNYNSGNNSGSESGSNQGGSNAGSTGGGSTATPDLSPYFDNLSQTIKDTNKDTNDILNKQLQKQDEISKATSNGFNSINSTLNDGFNRVHTDMNKMNNSLKDVGSNMENLDSRMNSHLNNSDDDDE